MAIYETHPRHHHRRPPPRHPSGGNVPLTLVPMKYLILAILVPLYLLVMFVLPEFGGMVYGFIVVVMLFIAKDVLGKKS